MVSRAVNSRNVGVDFFSGERTDDRPRPDRKLAGCFLLVLRKLFSNERDLFELGYATRLNRGAGLYLGL
jgi:hypothetical protein